MYQSSFLMDVRNVFAFCIEVCELEIFYPEFERSSKFMSLSIHLKKPFGYEAGEPSD